MDPFAIREIKANRIDHSLARWRWYASTLNEVLLDALRRGGTRTAGRKGWWGGSDRYERS